jgi:hypothetical protein
MSEDLKSKQWFVKILYKNVVIDVKEVWADTESCALRFAHSIATSTLEVQCESRVETIQRTGQVTIEDCEYMIGLLKVMNDPRWYHFDDALTRLREAQSIAQMDNLYTAITIY